MDIKALGKMQIIKRMHYALSGFGRIGKYVCNQKIAPCKFQPILVSNYNYIVQR